MEDTDTKVITLDNINFDGLELYLNGIIDNYYEDPRIAKVQDGSIPCKILCLLFGFNCERKEFVYLKDLFDKVPEGKRMDKIMDGIQFDKDIKRVIFKYNSKRVSINKTIDILDIIPYLPSCHSGLNPAPKHPMSYAREFLRKRRAERNAQKVPKKRTNNA